MADLVYDEKVGWFDPAEQYCANGCKELAVGERSMGIIMDPDEPTDGFWEHVDKLCINCLSEPEKS